MAKLEVFPILIHASFDVDILTHTLLFNLILLSDLLGRVFKSNFDLFLHCYKFLISFYYKKCEVRSRNFLVILLASILMKYEISKRAHLAYFDKYTFSYKCNLKASLHLLCSKKALLWY